MSYIVICSCNVIACVDRELYFCRSCYVIAQIELTLYMWQLKLSLTKYQHMGLTFQFQACSSGLRASLLSLLYICGSSSLAWQSTNIWVWHFSFRRALQVYVPLFSFRIVWHQFGFPSWLLQKLYLRNCLQGQKSLFLWVLLHDSSSWAYSIHVVAQA